MTGSSENQKVGCLGLVCGPGEAPGLQITTRGGLPVFCILGLVTSLLTMPLPAAGHSGAKLRMETDAKLAGISFLSWDTEGGRRANTNLLRAQRGVGLRVKTSAGWQTGDTMPTERESPRGNQVVYRMRARTNAEVIWQIDSQRERISMNLTGRGRGMSQLEAVEMVVPFDAVVTPTTVLPKAWNEDGSLSLPAIISAPDFGQMLLSSKSDLGLKARLEGDRARHEVDLLLDLSSLRENKSVSLVLTPVYLPQPAGMKDKAFWQAARRGWFNAFQCSARWGDPRKPFSAPAGMLANNVISDPASTSLSFYADQAFFTPKLSPDISAIQLVRRTLDWWLNEKVLTNGEMICYWDKSGFLDANSAVLIAAWDYVEATGDERWLAQRIERLEFVADYLARRDVDSDGLVEARQSGNDGTLQQPARSCAWWDALNCGHKDAYSNAQIYRAWRCLADLEAKLKRRDRKAHYTRLADRLKAAYAPTLFNPQTGWLAWWKSEDGTLHDLASPVVNGLAIEYGLVEPPQGREILARLRKKMREVGFTRLDLGVPPMLTPVRPGEYLGPTAIGRPQNEDGTDTFGYYMNGAVTAGQVLHFLAAHYVVGEGKEADKILRAMLERQKQGGFQNGAVDAYPKGVDWTTWDGKPAGYEGYLADSFRFLQAVLLREPKFRTRLYRPLKLECP